MKRKFTLLIAFFVVFMMAISPAFACNNLPAKTWCERPRDEVAWTTGAKDPPSHLNPWSTTPDPMSQLMFETLFGFNSATQEYVPCIGTEFEWLASGDELHIKLNPNATWSNCRQINATDVYSSYKIAANQSQWKTDFALRFESYNIVNETGFMLNMNPSYPYSKRALTWISSNVPILPWYEVLEPVNATYDIDGSGNLSLWTNDWWSPAHNDDWKVLSGPYAPVYRDAAQQTSIFQKRDDWWGRINTSLYSDLDNWANGGPKYVGHRITDNNDAAFRSGNVDLHAGYYDKMQNDFDDSAFLKYANGWFGRDAPYQAALSSPLNVAFNHEYGFPLNESYFREAMAWMINYDPIPDAAASGYTRKSEATFLDSLSTVHAPYFNDSLADTYRRTYNQTHAAKILTDHNWTGTIGGTWLMPGSVPVPTLTMICPQGWDDVRTFTEYVSNDFQAFGIPVIYEAIDTDAVGGWKIWTERWTTRNYELGMSVGEPKVIEPPEVFFNAWRGDIDWNNNVTGWNSATAHEFDALYLKLESESDPIKYQYYLDEIQRIFCEEIPEIPCFVNGYWYTYSEYYWEGWTSSDNEYQQLITVWTNNHIPMKHRMILNLVSTGRPPLSSHSDDYIPWTGLEIFMILGLVSTIVLVGYKIYRKKR